MQTLVSPKLPILIVGAGPSGLMLALILAKFGEKVRIIDKDVSINPYSRAIGVQIRTLEIFKSLGLVQNLRKHALPLSSIKICNEFGLKFSIRSFYEFSIFHNPWIVDQSDTQKVLEESLKKLGIEVERGVTLTDFTQEENKVIASLLNSDGQAETFHASYLVGADGAHSFVRKKLNHKFSGTSYEDAFILADACFEQEINSNSASLFLKHKKFLAVLPLAKKNHYRLISVRKNDKNKEGQEPTKQEFQDLIKELTNLPAISSIQWMARFFVRCLSVENYQKKRVFLIGDAAHIHSPAGGQGMNTGLQDAFNLGFKLSMVSSRLAKEKVLSTYHDERKPVGDFLIQNTDKLFSFIVKNTFFLRIARTLILLFLSIFKIVPSKLMSILSQTNIRYEKGLVCSSSKHNSISCFSIGKRIYCWQLKNKQNALVDLHSIVLGLYFSCFIIFPFGSNLDKIKECKDYARNLFKKFNNTVRLFFVYLDANKQINENDEYIFDNPHKDLKDQISYVLIRPDQHIFCCDHFVNIEHAKSCLQNFLI